jgi:trans-2,3-dihydro-3-hydroxyanthranilate isomerase
MMRRYVTVDVFTDERFRGNPLAVVLDAVGLQAIEMQQIAAEFGYSETTFVLPPTTAAHTAEVRIFTPTGEVPFAGHPNVGTAVVLAREWHAAGRELPATFLFEQKAGLVPVRIGQINGVPTSAELTAPEALSMGPTVSTEDAALSLGIDPSEVVVHTHAPTVASVGLPFLVVEINSIETLSRASGDLAAHRQVLQPIGTDGVYGYVRRQGTTELSARMFAPLDKVPEDPATGSATAATLALLATVEGMAGEHSWRVIQGEHMGRRSILRGRTLHAAGKLVSVHVGGHVVEVMRGTLCF